MKIKILWKTSSDLRDFYCSKSEILKAYPETQYYTKELYSELAKLTDNVEKQGKDLVVATLSVVIVECFEVISRGKGIPCSVFIDDAEYKISEKDCPEVYLHTARLLQELENLRCKY